MNREKTRKAKRQSKHPVYRKETLDAMEEALRMKNDPNVKTYKTMEELTASLNQ